MHLKKIKMDYKKSEVKNSKQKFSFFLLHSGDIKLHFSKYGQNKHSVEKKKSQKLAIIHNSGQLLRKNLSVPWLRNNCSIIITCVGH